MDIYVMDADGSNQRNLTNNDRRDEEPSWSPDGKRIVFTSVLNGVRRNWDIYVMDADGSNQQNLTNHRDRDWHPYGHRTASTSPLCRIELCSGTRKST